MNVEEAWRAGYEAGHRKGRVAGYLEGVAVLDDAAGRLARLRPAQAIDVAAARQRQREGRGPSLTPDQIRVRAYQSWGMPVPADLTNPDPDPEPVPEPAVSPPEPEPEPEPVVSTPTLEPESEPAGRGAEGPDPTTDAASVQAQGAESSRLDRVAELADDDDWIWQL